MPFNDRQACNNCDYTGTDLWIISGKSGHRNCTRCVADNVQKCETCQTTKIVECLYESGGCSAVFKGKFVNELEHHLNTCKYRKVPCPNGCLERLYKKDLVHHMSHLCAKRFIQCSHCENCFFAEEIEHHSESCGHVLVKCEFCDEQALRKNMDTHLKECTFAVWPCEFSMLGCNFRGTSDDLQKHLAFSTHAKLLKEHEKKSAEDLNMLDEKVKRLVHEVSLLKEDHKKSDERLQTSEENERNLQEEGMALRGELVTAKQDIEKLNDAIYSLNERLTATVIHEAGVIPGIVRKILATMVNKWSLFVFPQVFVSLLLLSILIAFLGYIYLRIRE